jgi:hypothetical protein
MDFNERKPSIVPDFVRNAIQGSLKSLLSSEEGIRSILREALPTEIFGYVKEVIDAAKTEGLRIVSAQTRDFLEALDVDTLLEHMVANYRVKVSLDIELEPKGEGTGTTSAPTVTVERKRSAGRKATKAKTATRKSSTAKPKA